MQPHLGLTVLGTGRHYPLAPGASVTIGRTADSEIHVDDQAVSRRHCTIEAVGDALLVTDLDSVNGTFVNEQLIDRARALPGDTIRVGATVLNVTGRARGAAAAHIDAVGRGDHDVGGGAAADRARPVRLVVDAREQRRHRLVRSRTAATGAGPSVDAAPRLRNARVGARSPEPGRCHPGGDPGGDRRRSGGLRPAPERSAGRRRRDRGRQSQDPVARDVRREPHAGRGRDRQGHLDVRLRRRQRRSLQRRRQRGRPAGALGDVRAAPHRGRSPGRALRGQRQRRRAGSPRPTSSCSPRSATRPGLRCIGCG